MSELPEEYSCEEVESDRLHLYFVRLVVSLSIGYISIIRKYL